EIRLLLGSLRNLIDHTPGALNQIGRNRPEASCGSKDPVDVPVELVAPLLQVLHLGLKSLHLLLEDPNLWISRARRRSGPRRPARDGGARKRCHDDERDGQEPVHFPLLVRWAHTTGRSWRRSVVPDHVSPSISGC